MASVALGRTNVMHTAHAAATRTGPPQRRGCLLLGELGVILFDQFGITTGEALPDRLKDLVTFCGPHAAPCLTGLRPSCRLGAADVGLPGPEARDLCRGPSASAACASRFAVNRTAAARAARTALSSTFLLALLRLLDEFVQQGDGPSLLILNRLAWVAVIQSPPRIGHQIGYVP